MATRTPSPARTLSVGTCAAAVMTCAAVLTACQPTAATDKSGGDTAVLRLATTDGEVNPSGELYGPAAFVSALPKVSGGRLKVKVATEFGGGTADAESRLVRAIARGDVDGGWPSTRAFSAADVPGLEAVETPMTLTSYAAEKALVRSPAAATILDQLHHSGVVGLGLAVGPLRRPFADKHPMLGPDDWREKRFRTYNSPIQSATIRALGGVPESVGLDWLDQVKLGRLDGAEFDVPQFVKIGGGAAAGNITSNVVLWPKMFVLSLSQKRWDALNARQRGWVRAAGEAAVQASLRAHYDERRPASQLCQAGARFVPASSSQLRALRTRLAIVGRRIERDPAEAPVWRGVVKAAERYPRTDVVPAPPGCDGRVSLTPIGAIPRRRAALPDGVYRVTNSETDVSRSGFDNSGGLTGTWTLKIGDGTYQLTCRPVAEPGTDCGHTVTDVPLEAGQLRGSGHTAYFAYDAHLLAKLTGCTLPVSQSRPGACFDGYDYRMTWELHGSALTFSHYRAATPDGQYLVQQWRRIS